MAKLGLLAGALAEQAGVRVSGGEMRVILALLPMEVALRIATASRRRRRPATVLRYKALHAGPRFDQCPIDREMLAGEQFSHLRQMALAKNLAAISPSSSRSRFLQNTVASQTGSSGESPTNQRNSRL